MTADRVDDGVTGHLDCVLYDVAELVVGPARDESGSAQLHAGAESSQPATESSTDDTGPTDTNGSTEAVGQPLDVRHDAGIAIVDGIVAAVGSSGEIVRKFPPENASTSLSVGDRAVIPGFVDPHTHAVFAGDRSDEFEAKLRGKTYQEIMAAGGGILRTVRAVREASDEQLLDGLLSHLDVMLAHGSTTVEVKSGYGLDTETERRMLEAIDRANQRHPIDLVATFMGAHAVPENRDTDEYVEEIVTEQLPAVANQGVATFCDVFCEDGVFDVDQSRRVLEAGMEMGLTPRVHAEEFTRLGGAQLAADLGAASADHLLCATDDDVTALHDADVVPVLLPGTAFGLGAEYADARSFLDDGGRVALATDFNPNCHSHSMGFAMTLGCVGMSMTPAEALVGATRTAARSLETMPGSPPALDRIDTRGTLRPGAPGDLAILDAPSYVHIPYTFGVNVVQTVIKNGRVVHE